MLASNIAGQLGGDIYRYMMTIINQVCDTLPAAWPIPGVRSSTCMLPTRANWPSSTSLNGTRWSALGESCTPNSAGNCARVKPSRSPMAYMAGCLGSGAITKALDYSLKRWTALVRYLDDGNLPIDNNRIENQIRSWGLGRAN